MMKKYISKIIIILIGIILIGCTKSYCAEGGTVRIQIIEGTDPWVNINVSESYKECELLNASTSTLGTSALQAHLTTDADWSAMAIFSVSQYGGATTNNPKMTNGNNSGIYDVAAKYVQTTGILSTATKSSTAFSSGFFNENGTTKKYVKQWLPDRESNNFVGFNTTNGTFGWLNSWTYYGNRADYPHSIKNGLFGVDIGVNFSNYGTSGGPYDSVTFRPVIWN